jgi:hypothetical protein
MILESMNLSKSFLLPSVLFTMMMAPLYYPWARVNELEGIVRALHMSFPFHEQDKNSCGLWGILPEMESAYSLYPSFILCVIIVAYYSIFLMRMPKPRTLFIALSNLAIAIYLVKRDSEYQDICLCLLPSLVAVMDLRPSFLIQMMFIEFSLLPDFQSPMFCVISVIHLVLWKLYFNST